MKYKGNLIFILIIAIIAIAIAFSYYWNIEAAKSKTNDIVKQQSHAFFSEIVTTRQWNAGHGGVYVPVNEEIQPNKYLDVPNRDVYTTDSILLTKINPAFMTRLISEIAAEKDGIKYHLTSLKLTNPNNKADEWETKTLKSFENGKTESFKYFTSDSTYRYMAPLMITKTCMQCHAKNGYKLGEVRGGISVTTPGKELMILLAKQKLSILIAHVLIFLVFLVFLILVWILNFKQFQKINKNNNLLKKQSDELILQQEATEELNVELTTKNIETQQAKSDIDKYNTELILQQEATEKLSQEFFAKSIEAEQAKQELEASTEQIRVQAAIAEILSNTSGTERNLNEFLSNTLNILFKYKWLNVLKKGAILLIHKDKKIKFEVTKGIEETFDDDFTLKPNEGICGKALTEMTMVLCNKKTNTDQTLIIDSKKEFGHVVMPIIFEDNVLGIINLFTDINYELANHEISFIQIISNAIASEIYRIKQKTLVLKTKEELELKNKHIRKYLVQLEQQTNERESLNQMILAQKKQVELKNKEVLKQKDELEEYSKQLEGQSLEQETITQKLFAQKLEVEQRNMETQQYAKQLEKQANEQETLNQKIFAQKLEVEQRNVEVEQYSKQLEKHSNEQEVLNQQLFAQKLEVEQRNIEVQQYLKQIEVQNQEQESLNQKLFAQNMEVEQKSWEIEKYSKDIEIHKEKAEKSLKHLNDSINYSKYIQDSLLPLDSFIDKNIPGDYFIYYNPKETIGGDFYYANKTEDYLILGVADCTGHGVPGALITMLGITFLNDIVDRNLVDNTGEALGLLRDKIKTTFRSYGSNLQNKNGLDIALCAINLKTNIMQFSGAFNPLYIFRNNELIEYKGTRNPIGYYPVEKDFETHEIQLQKDDIIYLFSDGYPDQIGGPKGRKFSKRQFKDLLQEIHKFPIAKQQVFIETIMQKWMTDTKQVDDITLMAIKWNN